MVAPAPESCRQADSDPSVLWPDLFRQQLEHLLRWRRDERHFRSDVVSERLLRELVDHACLAPSVGHSQPWRFVHVVDDDRRSRIIDIFERENTAAVALYPEERSRHYAALKLSGLHEAPVHLAVFCDEGTAVGHGLGRRTMPETLRYSVVCAIHTLWLAAHARGLGVGWVSILDPGAVRECLDTPPDWALVAYLCIGWPKEAHSIPELERKKWQERLPTETFLIDR